LPVWQVQQEQARVAEVEGVLEQLRQKLVLGLVEMQPPRWR
jgi:hypothetical protein